MRIIFFFLSLVTLPLSANLAELEKLTQRELDWISYPDSWHPEDQEVLDVAIVGSGMAGCATAFGLKNMGIHHICLFDQSPEGLEGPWITYAHMQVLRSAKCAMGPCLHFPSLSFQAWYEAKWGVEAWSRLIKPTPACWMEYLFWFRQILQLPVVNLCRLTNITPLSERLFKLDFDWEGTPYVVFTKKVVLATGRLGFGGAEIPTFMDNVPKNHYAHTSELIAFKSLTGKRIAILGCGSSAYDAAAMALEAKAKSVDLLFRRSQVPTSNKLAQCAYVGFEQGFHLLSDEWRWRIMSYASQSGTPPPQEALARVSKYSQFHLKPGVTIESINVKGQQLILNTTQGEMDYDYLILATGFHMGGEALPELQNLMPHISLWLEHAPQASVQELERLGQFPYLGNHYQLIEKEPGTAPYLKHIYCFNYGALLSHGLTCCFIDAISTGALRLSQGIAADFFLEDIDHFFDKLQID